MVWLFTARCGQMQTLPVATAPRADEQMSRPLSTSSCVIVVRSQRTKNARSGLVPSSAPSRHLLKRNSSTVRPHLLPLRVGDREASQFASAAKFSACDRPNQIAQSRWSRSSSPVFGCTNTSNAPWFSASQPSTCEKLAGENANW